MARACVCAGLVLAILVLGGCSNIQRIDLSQVQPYTGKDPYTGDDISSRKSSWRPPREVVAHGPGVYVVEDPPPPKVESKERKQLEADEAEQDRAIARALQSICRAC